MEALGRVVNEIEETLIAVLLGLMTIVTFANVVARYGFNSNILWALEITVFMFGWLVLLGASYAVKIHSHLGVDALINTVEPTTRRILGLISVTACIVFSFLLLKGSWDYWANFANLPGTTGRWFPTGFESEFRPKGWYEVNDIPLPEWLRWMEDAFNDGDEYEKIPRMIPYAVLPLGMALLLFRFLQAAWDLLHGHKDRLVASHEVEDDIDALQHEENT
ncbi:TRAP transporter small permease [Tropicimonas sp. TH_r6]|uniref:TRAP transporter small permease n=1 Tax=Tropicimonas sp. TH_r6 TaxID=3082085 RepID=UPI002955C258|nr:TRAP transporter small permease [Tropicimonas sp. TH_r6]MDV7142744.1 TRAP transporter small permease [Tropicimonas sp. TH_r6]